MKLRSIALASLLVGLLAIVGTTSAQASPSGRATGPHAAGPASLGASEEGPARCRGHRSAPGGSSRCGSRSSRRCGTTAPRSTSSSRRPRALATSSPSCPRPAPSLEGWWATGSARCSCRSPRRPGSRSSPCAPGRSCTPSCSRPRTRCSWSPRASPDRTATPSTSRPRPTTTSSSRATPSAVRCWSAIRPPSRGSAPSTGSWLGSPDGDRSSSADQRRDHRRRWRGRPPAPLAGRRAPLPLPSWARLDRIRWMQCPEPAS